jgi:hypothetical protein
MRLAVLIASRTLSGPTGFLWAPGKPFKHEHQPSLIETARSADRFTAAGRFHVDTLFLQDLLFS